MKPAPSGRGCQSLGKWRRSTESVLYGTDDCTAWKLHVLMICRRRIKGESWRNVSRTECCAAEINDVCTAGDSVRDRSRSHPARSRHTEIVETSVMQKSSLIFWRRPSSEFVVRCSVSQVWSQLNEKNIKTVVKTHQTSLHSSSSSPSSFISDNKVHNYRQLNARKKPVANVTWDLYIGKCVGLSVSGWQGFVLVNSSEKQPS
jgi:hypothetical protein